MWNGIGSRTRVLLILIGLLSLPAALRAETAGFEGLRKQAALLEQRHDWLEACRVYDEILRRDRNNTEARQAYQRCLRRYHIVHRHRDRIYRQALARVSAVQALDMYEQVLDTIANAYFDSQKTSVTALFRQGVEELRLALEEPVFREEYFSEIPLEALEGFKSKLDDWSGRKVAGRSEARAQVMALGRIAQQLSSNPRPLLITVIALEFLSGACNALDEYSFFLTPGHYREIQAALRGRLVSIGVDLVQVEDRIEIGRVYPRSPAWEAGLARHDRILRIDGQPADTLPAEVAAERLRGKPSSIVELEVLPANPTMMETRTLRLKRRPVVVPSVEHELKTVFVDTGDGMAMPVPIGKLRINCFQESTLQEVKEALAQLQTDGMKVLILDLRGNPGGLFDSAVDVAELFLPEGIIVVPQSHSHILPEKYKKPIKVRSLNPLLVPMAVVIDGDTASSAEVLAGALKENGRATLIGTMTFGKGSIQCVLPLEKPPFDKMPGGIRITVAKLLSPSWQPYNRQGVRPNIHFDADGDAVLAEAQRILLEMLKPMPPMPMIPN
jgi:carboxyl-terminal processing protease